MRIFPLWASHLGLRDAQIRGIDCRPHDDPETYREIVSFLKGDTRAVGALVTTHKIDLLDATRDLFDALDPQAELLGEVSCISKRAGKLWGHALDPITGGLALGSMLGADYWPASGGHLCALGAGGASVALTVSVMTGLSGCGIPDRIIVVDVDPGRLEHARGVHEAVGSSPVSYHLSTDTASNDRLLNDLPACSVVVNATGMGKDSPGSPLSERALFPRRGHAWELNYRGDLLFYRQAEAQRTSRSLTVSDGWHYFIHGWSRAIAEVFGVEIPASGPEFELLSGLAGSVR